MRFLHINTSPVVSSMLATTSHPGVSSPPPCMWVYPPVNITAPPPSGLMASIASAGLILWPLISVGIGFAHMTPKPKSIAVFCDGDHPQALPSACEKLKQHRTGLPAVMFTKLLTGAEPNAAAGPYVLIVPTVLFR